MDTIEQLRLQLIANGYTPIANYDKRCFLKGWPDVVVDAAEVHRWSRRHKRFAATGLRVENGLAVIDIDVNAGPAVADAIAEAVYEIAPVAEGALVRRGKGTKEAWFVRTAESFSRIHTRRWIAPGSDVDAGTHVLEIFGGLAPRQFGAFGAHTADEAGNVLVEYRWDGESPADVRLDDLPILTKAEFFAVADAVEHVLAGLGFTPVAKSSKGESDAVRVYDLTDDMQFDLADGRRVLLPELRQLAKDEEGLRCSASWLEGPDPKRSPDRCIIGTTRQGSLTVWDSATGQTHMGADAKPRDFTLELDRVAEKLKELDVRKRNAIKPRDGAVAAAHKLLETYGFCPPTGLVVPLYADQLEAGITMTSFRTMMLPYCDEDVGPRGGRIVVNPVDIWSGSERRVTIDGLRLRPDKPRPTYEEGDATWVNIYSPPLHPTEGGDAGPGIAFLEHLLPDETERKWFLQWLSFKYQRPDIPGPAVLMVAREHGTGRGTLGELVARLFGRSYVKNIPFKTFAGQSYQSQYTDWGASTLLAFVAESSETADGSAYQTKRNTYEHLKELVEPRAVERYFVVKGGRSFHAPSFTSYIIATNNVDALPIPANDRRFAVLSNGAPRPVEYWEGVNAWMDDPANIGAFARWLLEIDLAGYSPFAAPIETAAKADMSDAARSDLDRGFEDVVTMLPSDVFVPEQVILAMSQARRIHGYDYPDKWQPIAKKMLVSKCWRVGRGDAVKPMIDGQRYRVYARSAAAAKQWAQADAKWLRSEVLKNGSPSATEGNVLAGLFRRVAEKEQEA